MMQSPPLACPHCGSMLNFGTEIAAQSSVDCLVCMQSFSMQERFTPTPTDSNTMPLPKVAPTAGTSKRPTARKTHNEESRQSNRHAAPAVAAITEMPIADIPDSGTVCTHWENSESATGSPKRKILLAVVGLGVFFLLAAGISLSMWKPSGNAGDESRQAPPKEELLAVNKNVVPESPAKEVPQPPAEEIVPPPETTKPARSVSFAEAPRLNLQPENDPQPKPDEKSPAPANAKDVDAPIPVKDPVNPGIAPPAIGGLNPNRPLPWGVDQPKINAAIDKGVVYLKANQNANGSWGAVYPIGHAAIGGLTLLESGVPANDPVVQRAASLVRNNVANLDQTYELALAILFLDRLGERRDRFTIQTLALRLAAGQTASGGWTYHCRVLNPTEMNQLFTFLQATKKPNVFDKNLLMARAEQPDDGKGLMGKDVAGLNDPVKEFGDRILIMATENPMSPNKLNSVPPPMKGTGAKGANQLPGKANPAAMQPNGLKQNLQTLPILQQQSTKKGQFKLSGDRSDNSNTQFALLALWVAGRHDVPAGPAFLAAHQRFFGTQRTDGGWSYQPLSPKGSTPSMTCVGLLGMAMGHGAQPEVIGVNPKNAKEIIIKPAIQDPKVQIGVKALARAVGTPAPKARPFPMHNLYELWSIERVAMLYDLKAIDGKDWYGWGAQILLHNQRADGAWAVSQYHGQNPHLNTCLALLFLKRSNLASDLTRSLRLESASSEPLRANSGNTSPP
jgi:hypothetical protein